MSKSSLKFIIVSIIGFIFFVMPITIAGKNQIAIAHIAKFITTNLLSPFLIFTQIVSTFVIIGTLFNNILFKKSKFLTDLFSASMVNKILRVLGSILYIITVNSLFLETPILNLFTDGNTGGVLAGGDGLLTILYITFFVGLLALPSLTHFGAVEFLGTLLAPFMRKVFKVPGYSAVDAIASFVGDGTIGIVVTDNQYKRGYYTKKEAFIIATNFSIVGVAFASSVATELGFGSIFNIFYLSIALVTVVIAIISARLPYKKYADTYYENIEPKNQEVPKDIHLVKYAFTEATKQAEKTNIKEIIIESFKNILNIYIGFLPIIMIVGSTSLVLAEYTPIFTWLSIFLVPVYELLGFTKEVATQMAPATIVGIADMYLPALFITETPSEAARFFIGVLSFTQLIFMSETGMVLVKTKLDVNFFDVIKIFLYRTLLSIPIVFVIVKVLVSLSLITM
ncbi:MAG: YjiH family protein [Lachnospirales bacterium]